MGDKATREGGGGREGRTGHRESQWRATMGQGLSFDLTQEEIEDLQDSCDSKFTQTEIQILYKRFLKLDKDKKGFISRLDLEHVLRQRVGASLNEEEMDKFLTKVMEDSGSKQERLDFKTFCKCFVEDEDFSMDVDIPSDDELG